MSQSLRKLLSRTIVSFLQFWSYLIDLGEEEVKIYEDQTKPEALKKEEQTNPAAQTPPADQIKPTQDAVKKEIEEEKKQISDRHFH
jgi:hypothetical protein